MIAALAPLNSEMGRRLGYMPGPTNPRLHGLGALGTTYSVGQDPLTGEPATVDQSGNVIGPVGYDAQGDMVPLAPSGAVASPASLPAAAIPSPAAQVPSGTQMIYTATVASGWGDLFSTVGGIQSAFDAALPPGFSVLSSTVTAGGGLFAGSTTIQWEILDSIGNQYLSDAKSIFDAALKGVVGNNVQSSNLNIVNTPNAALPTGTVVAAAPQAVTSAATWLENNAVWLAVGVGGLILLSSLMGKKR